MKIDLNEQARLILEQAQQGGNQLNFFFATTFDRYMTQLRTAQRLKQIIENEDVLVTKEYVKGRGNVYSNPAIKDYNATVDSANKTVGTLMKILKQFNAEEIKETNSDDDILMRLINGDMND